MGASGSTGYAMQSIRRLLRLVIAAALVAVVLASTAAGDVSRCTYGASSVGPVVIVNGHFTRDATPHTEACLH